LRAESAADEWTVHLKDCRGGEEDFWSGKRTWILGVGRELLESRVRKEPTIREKMLRRAIFTKEKKPNAGKTCNWKKWGDLKCCSDKGKRTQTWREGELTVVGVHRSARTKDQKNTKNSIAIQAGRGKGNGVIKGAGWDPPK